MSSGKKAAYISLLAAAIGLLTAVCGFLAEIFPPSWPPDPPQPTRDDQLNECNPAALDSQLRLSDGAGPSGTELTVSGTGFCPEVEVRLLFGTDTLQLAETDPDGAFAVDVRIPGTLDFAAPMQVDIRARGDRGSFASTPFQLTQ